jgi:hypothetical protein
VGQRKNWQTEKKKEQEEEEGELKKDGVAV